ncbi:hypothetical protein Hden_2856 [Hyphomicrobium denitrificans ATCC 51888]|uniref:GYF domain-containing protein n=1 Tax=Hyphomicrobium denitrificans (strain ATCC 51888 / DSM 1869 / NCIMB 11706 / TK 0415) TaxID=582899 RepID=D8JUM2_HYPDA|nr:DUF4339 domain-containing protein [Hyphomicrobium denitrificans]ADJ24652.1 hypothetical protein Hden_2856 [Hyphomicrobium denitrificans ATCC 51888]
MTGQADDIQWYIARDGKQHGPLTDVELRTFIAHSYLRQTDLIWRPGMSEWQAAPAVFPAAFHGGSEQPQAIPQAHRAAPAPTYTAQSNASAQYAPHSGFDGADARPQRGNLVKRLAIASIALTVIGGGAFALATYHGPLMEIVSGGSDTTSGDQAPVVAAPDEVKLADAHPQNDAASAEPTPPAASDVIPAAPPEPQQQTAESPAQPQQSPPPSDPQTTTTASVSKLGGTSGSAQGRSDMQVAAVEPEAPEPAPPAAIDGSSLDGRLQKVPVWELIKAEYPDWYTSQISTANKMVADKKSDNEVAMSLAQGLVNLRRQNADKALAASSEKLQAIAVAFLAHLKSLRSQSVSACFGFISKGETSPAVVQMMEHPETATALNAQADAVFQAISEGRKNPVKHDSAVKSDYDVLIKELAKLGWKEDDLQVFSNPKLLAKREPEQVCKMVQEWFVAHLAVQDKATRDRLLYETLKPVVSG